MDVWNSRSVGSWGIVTLGLGVHLASEAIEVIEQYGRPGDPDATDAERVSAYRRTSDGAIEGGPIFFAVRIRAGDGREGWLGFEHNDAAEVIVVNGSPNWSRSKTCCEQTGGCFHLMSSPRPPGGSIPFRMRSCCTGYSRSAPLAERRGLQRERGLSIRVYEMGSRVVIRGDHG